MLESVTINRASISIYQYTKKSKANKQARGMKHEQSPTTDSEERAAKVPRRKNGRACVQRNSLNEDELIQARDQAKAKAKLGRSSEQEQVSQEDVQEEQRRAANRLYAFQSRQRCKGTIKSLEQVVKDLTAANEQKYKPIQDQKVEMKSLGADNARLPNEISRQDDEILALKQELVLRLAQDHQQSLQRQQLPQQPETQHVQTNLLQNTRIVELATPLATAQPSVAAQVDTAPVISRLTFPSATTTFNSGSSIPFLPRSHSFAKDGGSLLAHLQSQQHLVGQSRCVSPANNTTMLKDQHHVVGRSIDPFISSPARMSSESSLIAHLRSLRFGPQRK
jgi:hypothetical protein